MAKITPGIRTISSVKAVNASTLPRKRHHQSFLKVKEGAYHTVNRASSDNERAARVNVNHSPRLPIVMGRIVSQDRAW